MVFSEGLLRKSLNRDPEQVTRRCLGEGGDKSEKARGRV